MSSENNASCSSLAAQKEVEDMSFENALSLSLNDRYSASTSKEVYKSDRGADVMNYESDKENKERNDDILKCLGSGQTLIRMSVYKTIKWDSYTKATRQLLTELFPRTVLATHCLSGQKSPAFRNKVAKQCLNARIIADIIETICRECGVKENMVRHVITIKCADEDKMLRQRENKGQKMVKYNSKQKKVSSKENQGPERKKEEVSDEQHPVHISEEQNNENLNLTDEESQKRLMDQEIFCKELGLVQQKLSFGY